MNSVFQCEFMQIVNFLWRRRVRVYARPKKNSLDAWIRLKLVEMRRIELLTPCLQGRCSPSWATPPDRILYVANFCFAKVALVGLSGLEPPTSRLSGVRSNRLSYRPMQGFFNGFLSSFPLIFSSIFNCECPISRLYTQKQIVRFLSLRISLFVRP